METLAPQGRDPGLWGRELRPLALFLRSRGTGGPRRAPIPPVEGSSSVGWTQGHPPLPPWSKLRHSPELWQPQQNHPLRPRCEHLSPGPYMMPGHQTTSQRPGAQASSLGAEGWPGQGAFCGSPVRATDGSPLATSLLAEHCLDHSPFSLRDGSGKAKEYARLLPQTRKRFGRTEMRVSPSTHTCLLPRSTHAGGGKGRENLSFSFFKNGKEEIFFSLIEISPP